tara:strand:- start:612 stop:1946 length:1335 start_codon:yes stop_codon:yes gene_type:complete
MATEALFYMDGLSLEQATSIYTDIDLTTLAADGFYSNGAVSREQINGVLQPQAACANCAAPPPPTSTIYDVTQNVTNNIVGTLGINYTLSGSGYSGSGAPLPVTQSGPDQAPYNFVIVATPGVGFQFSQSNDFNATNPSGLMPPNPSGTTVTNVLTGTIEPKPSDIPTMFYKLNGCSGSNGETPVGGWIERTITNKPGVNQRFVTTNTTPEEYYVYDSATAAQGNISVADQLENPGGRDLVLSLLAGETGCPEFNVTTELVVQLTRCSDNSTDFYFRTQNHYALEAYTRNTNDGGATIFTINQNLLPDSQLAGKTEIFDLKLIDVNGVVDGEPGFTGKVIGCPTESYWMLQACDPSGQPTNNLRVSTNPVNDPLFNNGGAGFVYRDDGKDAYGGVCWKLINQTTTPANFITNTTPALTLVVEVGPDCQACTLQGPGPGGPSFVV